MTFHGIPVRCEDCDWDSVRVRRDDGTYGLCKRCHGRMVPSRRNLEKRIAVAKADLAQLDRQA